MSPQLAQGGHLRHRSNHANIGCIRYDKMGETVTAYDVKSGELRAKILKTAPGNAENLAP